MKYLPHLSLFRTFYRALRRAGIPLAFSQGHTPHPKIQFGPPLPLGYEGEAEYLDLEITSLLHPDSILRQLSAFLPPGLEVRRLVRIPLKSRSLFDMVNLQTYRTVLPKERLPDPDPGDWLLSRIVGAEKLLLHRSRNGKTRTTDMRPLVAKAELIGEDAGEIVILLALRRSGDLSARPSDVLRVAGGFGPEEDHYWKITRTANLVVQEKQWHSPINLPDWLIKRTLPTCRR